MVKPILQLKSQANRTLGAGSALHCIPVAVLPALSVWTQAHVCWYAPSVSQLCCLSLKRGPDERRSIPPHSSSPNPVTSSVPSRPWQHGWPLSPCQHPGIMWPVTKAHSTSGGTLQLAAPWWEPQHEGGVILSAGKTSACSSIEAHIKPLKQGVRPKYEKWKYSLTVSLWCVVVHLIYPAFDTSVFIPS